MKERVLSVSDQLKLSEDLARRCLSFARDRGLDFNAALVRLRVEDPGFAARLSAAYGGDLER